MNATRHPVLEVAVLDVKPGRADAFLEAFATAEPIIASSPGYGGHELRRCAENRQRFLLLVRWDAIDSHTVGFRGSPAYQEWKRLLHDFYDPFPIVEHYLPERGSTASGTPR
jgi:heme-degrading monooxygenase HmoA